MTDIFDRVLTLNLIANTVIFYVAARLYLLPLVSRFRHGRSVRCDHDRDDLQCAGRDGTSLLDPGVLGPIVTGDALCDFCSSSTPLGKVSPRCDRQRNLSGRSLIVLVGDRHRDRLSS